MAGANGVVGLVAQHHAVMEPNQDQEVAQVHIRHMVVQIVRGMLLSTIPVMMDTVLHMVAGDNGQTTRNVVSCVEEDSLREDVAVTALHQRMVVMTAPVKAHQEWSVMGINVQVKHT